MIYWVCIKNEGSGLFHYSKKLFSNLDFKDINWIDEEEVKNFKEFPIIYNLGNHPMNSEIYRYAFEYPGYVLLHDLNLHHSALPQGKEEYFEVQDKVYKIREAGVWIDNLELYSPAISNLLKRQKGIFVHSRYAQEILKMWNIKTPSFYIPMGTETFKENFEKIPLSLGIFGHRGINRKLKETSKIILKLKEEIKDLKVIICGGGSREGLEDLSFADFYENLPSKEFYDLLSRVQIIFNFRYPVYGETSLSTLEAMSRGTIPVVSSYGSYRELEGVVHLNKIEEGYFKIKKLFECPLYLNQLSRQARDFIEKHLSLKIWTERWKEILCGLKK